MANVSIVASDGVTPMDTLPVTSATSGNVAAATATATLAAVAGKTNYVTGFEIDGGGATAASFVAAVLSGILGGSISYTLAPPAGAALPMTPRQVTFNPPLPASGPGVAIVLTVPSLGAGNTNAIANIHGFAK